MKTQLSHGDKNKIYYQLNEVKEKFNLDYIINDDELIVFGDLNINHEYNKVKLSGVFYTCIKFDYNFPNSIPIVEDPKNMIFDFHKNANGTLCLGCSSEMILKIKSVYNNAITISKFIEIFVIPFYYSYLFNITYKTTPYGERSHGGLGIVEYYSDIFKTNNFQTLEILKYLSLSKYKGHHVCPCGSGKIIRECHKSSMILLIEKVGVENLNKDYKFICDEILTIDKTIKKKRIIECKKKKQAEKLNFYLFRKRDNYSEFIIPMVDYKRLDMLEKFKQNLSLKFK